MKKAIITILFLVTFYGFSQSYLAKSVNGVNANSTGDITISSVGRNVDTIYKNTAKDSIVFTISGIRYAIRDSSILVPTFSLSKNSAKDSIVTVFNGVRSAVRDSIGGGGSGGGASLSDLTAATATNTINNTNNKQRWQWNTIGADSAFVLESVSTTAASSLQNIFTVKLSGANATSGQTTRTGIFSNTHTGTTSTNIALELTASGATTNTALNVTAGNIAVPSDAFIYLRGAGGASYLRYNSASTLTELNGGTQRIFITTSHPSFIFADGSGGGSMMSIMRPATNNYGFIFGGQFYGGAYLGETTSSNTILSAGGKLTITGNTGQSGGFGAFTPNEIASFKPTGLLNIKPITATAASAITPAEGDIVMVSSTNGTFTSIGFWGYQNGAWTKM